ncbi:MAG TPA: DNA polymerase III subunit delta [Bellilinea sp.]|nr:DNA polymerase III subunit delta [Bellilinea sp.]
MSDSAAPGTLPVVTLLYGDDHQALHDRMEALAAQMGDPSLADMNITRMDAAESSTREEDVRTAAYTLPFLTARRMVIVNNPVSLMRSESGRQKFFQTLSSLPESTAMVLVQDDTWIPGGNQRGWKNLYEYKDHGKVKIHPLLEWARGASDKVKIEILRLPALNAMPGWIANEVKRQNGHMTPQAATTLAGIVGSDTGQARQEITKLLSYVDHKRPVEPEDVHELTAPGGQADVFVMVDALAMGDSRQALRQLGRLLEEQDAINLYGMVVRQYRLILMAKEARDNGVASDDAVGRLLGTAPFPAQKALNQARRYSFERLNQIYHRLHEIDRMAKTGQMDLEVALQAFVVEIGRS